MYTCAMTFCCPSGNPLCSALFAMSLRFRHVNSMLAAARRMPVVNAVEAVRWSHSRPEDVPESRRRKMLNRPSASSNGVTGRTGKKVFFMNSPTDPARGEGRSDAAGKFRRSFKHCSSWQEVMDLVETAKIEGKLEASVFSAAMQTCGNKGWWEGLLELRRVQQEEDVTLCPVGRSIALTALTHCLKLEHKHRVVPERVPIALKIAKEYWGEAGPARDVQHINIVLSSALKLATHLDCRAAKQWGLELWREFQHDAFDKHQITLSTYMCFLEQYQRSDEVDAFLQSQDDVVSKAIDVVLLSSLLNCAASRRDWLRAETLWEAFMKRKVIPNIIAHNSRAKVHLLGGRPGKVLEIYDNALAVTDFVRAMRDDFRVAVQYAQALLVLCHSSLDPSAVRRLREFLSLSVQKGPPGPKSFREVLLSMKSIGDKLVRAPHKVLLHDVLLDVNTREQSVMAKWEDFRAGSNYLEGKVKAKMTERRKKR